MAKSPIDKLLFKHPHLTHSTDVKVISHIQRAKNDWLINTSDLANGVYWIRVETESERYIRKIIKL